ncbi:hypothetical protein D3C74_275240 [compost metagenome]
MSAPQRVFDVDHGGDAWDFNGVRYLMSHHARDRLIEMAGAGAINLVGYVLTNGRWALPPESSKYAFDSEWVVIGDLTLAVGRYGRRRSIITALFNNDEAWLRHFEKKRFSTRIPRPGNMARLDHVNEVLRATK